MSALEAEEMNRCQICSEKDGSHRFDIGSEMGISPVTVCTPCFEWTKEKIDESGVGVCIACGGETAGKYDITEYGAASETAPICKECRDRVLFDDQPLRGEFAESGVGRMTDDDTEASRPSNESYQQVLRQRRRDGECDYCGGGENLNAEVVHGDVETARIDWVCDDCLDKGRGMK